MKRHVCFYLALAILIVSGCSRPGASPDYPEADVVDLSSLMRQWQYLDSAQMSDSLGKYRPEITAFMSVLSELPVDNKLIASWSRSLAVDRFTPAVDSVFPSHGPLRKALGHILGAASDAGLALPRRRYAAVVYGRQESILFTDSVMLVALNHYLGPEFEGYGRWPVYRRMDKSPERLSYDIAEALVGTGYPYVAEGADATLLSHMLYHGALAYVKMQLVPDAQLAEALGYAPDDLRWIDGNEEDIWKTIVASKLLYDTSEAVADRFVKPSPAVHCGDVVFPGRIGRYIGYRIVEAYMKANPGTPLATLLSPSFYTSPKALGTYRM